MTRSWSVIYVISYHIHNLENQNCCCGETTLRDMSGFRSGLYIKKILGRDRSQKECVWIYFSIYWNLYIASEFLLRI
jgi:hypothetical protein